MRKHSLFPVAVVLVLAAACGSESPREQARPSASEPADGEPAGGTMMAGDTSSAAGSCVERYSIETLTDRDYAFNGVVKAITPDPADGPDTVEFDVAAWYKGGSGPSATKKAYGFGGGMMTSAGGGSHEVGDRLLVAGDDEFIWECGFTQPYDDAVAKDWDAAL